MSSTGDPNKRSAEAIPSDFPRETTALREGGGVYTFQDCAFDSFTREFRYKDIISQLAEQEAKLLTAMLDHPDQLLTREQLAAVIWPEGEYVDYDRAINNIISRLRRYLHDDVHNPRFIRTVPKLGYRFCGDVVFQPRNNNEVRKPSGQSSVVSDIQTATGETEHPNPPLPNSRRWILHPITMALILAAVGVTAWLLRGKFTQAPSDARPYVIGVLPLSCPDGSTVAVAESLRTDLIESIAQIPGVEERAANSLSGLHVTAQTDLKQIAQQLNLTYLVVGSMTLEGDRFEVRLELVRGSDAMHLRTFVYTGNRSALATTARRFQEDLFASLGSKGSIQSLHGSTDNSRAYELHLRARHKLSERTLDGLNGALQDFHAALQIDANFARAYAGLAETHITLANYGGPADVQSNLQAAENYASQAITRNNSIAEAHSTLGLVHFQLHWNATEAEHELRRAIQLDPGAAVNHMRLAVLLADQGRVAEALHETDLARQLDPLWIVVHGTDMYVAIAARQFDRAIADGRALVSARPDWPRAYSQLGWAQWYGGQQRDAVLNWQKAAELQHDDFRSALEKKGLAILEQKGAKEYALFKVASMQSNPANAQRLDSDYVESEWLSFAGKRSEALQAITGMVRARNTESLKLGINPAYDFLLHDKEFENLRTQVGVYQAAKRSN